MDSPESEKSGLRDFFYGGLSGWRSGLAESHLKVKTFGPHQFSAGKSPGESHRRFLFGRSHDTAIFFKNQIQSYVVDYNNE